MWTAQGNVAWGTTVPGIPIARGYAPLGANDAHAYEDEEAFEEVDMVRSSAERSQTAPHRTACPRPPEAQLGRTRGCASEPRACGRPQNLLDHGRTHVCNPETFNAAPQPTPQARRAARP